ncbi:MAG TPA: DUF433 domain-containing protein [Candidatus Angelobacter sp.]|nr:DUF433 domain-containing protein [Candidatus Angelobacter sp.]
MNETGYGSRVVTGSFFHTIVLWSPELLPLLPEILGGTPVFAGTRVPVQTFIEYIKAGESIEAFLEGFPSINKEQLLAFLQVN